MGFTKKHSDQNKAMKARADELVIAHGYSYARENKNGSYNQEYVRRFQAKIADELSNEFPGIAYIRVRTQASAAVRRARGRAIRAIS
jgi:hypothetical protein